MACFWPGCPELSATPPKSIVLSIKAAGSHNGEGSLKDAASMGAGVRFVSALITFIYDELSLLYISKFKKNHFSIIKDAYLTFSRMLMQ